ncbi:MAG: hypothetical protein KKA55_02365 [Proteobacteria bacterium]|nr:hypothetical protein [Pseudomonadota bacterium]MBU1594363.1 hypothetical protein [Pseudomonadota bacterium]
MPFLAELWRVLRYVLSPEDSTAGAQRSPQANPDLRAPGLAGAAKTLFWAGLAVLAGIGLSRLSG